MATAPYVHGHHSPICTLVKPFSRTYLLPIVMASDLPLPRLATPPPLRGYGGLDTAAHLGKIGRLCGYWGFREWVRRSRIPRSVFLGPVL